MKTNGIIRVQRDSITRLGFALAAGVLVAVGSASAATVQWKGGSGDWDTITTNWLDGASQPTVFTDGDDALIGGSGGTVNVVGTVAPLSTAVEAASGDYTISGGVIGGAGSLTKSGGSRLTLTGLNTFTGKTSVQAGSLRLNIPGQPGPGLTNAGVAGPLGAPTGANAAIGFLNGTTLETGSTNPRVNQSTDRPLDLAGAGPGTVSIKVNDNDTYFQFKDVMASGTGAKTLAIYTGNSGNGDRESVIFTGAIADSSDLSPTSLQVTYRCQTESQSYVSLVGANTFTGPINLIKGGAVASAYLTVGGERTRNTNVPGTGSLGGGNYPGDIALGTNTIFNYLSSASQTLSGTISGVGAIIVDGTGTVTLAGTCAIGGNTTVNSGSTLVLASSGDYTFRVTDAAANKITGAGSATFNGSFTIDTSAVTIASGSWILVNATTKTFNPAFTVAGAGWSETANVWTKTEGSKAWTFTEATGVLSVTGPALFTSFQAIVGSIPYTGVIDNTLHTIRLVVPKDTNLAALAPTFTLTSGTCSQTSGAVPTPSFGNTNPATYTVTDGPTVNNYTVTVVPATGIINVSLERSGSLSNPALLTGPGGGLGETWNQVTTSSASGLRDSVGFVTGVGFTQSGGLDGIDQWGNPPLQMLWSGLRRFTTGATFQVVINGLTPGDYYHVYVGSANVNTGQRSKGDWSTPNPTFTTGIQSVDNTAVINQTTWEQGNNCVVFQYVKVDDNGRIVLDGDAADTYRLPLNGFQLVPSGSPAAMITSFGIPGSTGVIDQNAKTISLVVPQGADLASVAPQFTVTSGTCNQTSGSPPSPSFATSNPVHYVVTDGATVNDYAVTLVGSLTINLGAGTVIEGGKFGTWGATNLPLPSLPAGSVLRSIAVNTVLEATNNDNYASDLAVLLDPTPATPGGDFALCVTNGELKFGAAVQLGWPTAAGGPPPTPLVDTKTAADWAAAGTIDLHTTGLFLGNGYSSGAPGAGGTWSGTITLTHDLIVGGSDYAVWAASYLPADVSDPGADHDGDGMSNGQEHAFGLDPTRGSSVNAIAVPLNAAAGTFSYTRRATSGLAYTIWTSPDLQAWTQDAGAGQVPGTPDGNGVQTVAVTLTATPVGGKLFVRVRAN